MTKHSEEAIIRTIVERLTGVIDEEKAEKIYEAVNIKISNDGDVTVPGKPGLVLDKLLRTLLKEGDYLVKITLHNIAQENKLSICPLCKDVNTPDSDGGATAETGGRNDDNTDDDDDNNNKDLTAKVLYSGPSKKIILIALKSGASLDAHAVDAPVLVLCVSGSGLFEYEDKSLHIGKGDVISLDTRVVHNVLAKDDLELLITKYW